MLLCLSVRQTSHQERAGFSLKVHSNPDVWRSWYSLGEWL